MRKILLTSLLLTFSHSAYSLINAEASYGKRWYDSSHFKTTGTDVTVGVNIDPIPFIPVSVGLSYSSVLLSKSDFGSDKNAYINQLGIDAKAWAPLLPVFTPYVRVRYIAVSRLKILYNDGSKDVNRSIKGYALGVGLDYKIIPMVHTFVEASHTFPERKADFRSSSISIGLLVGI